MQLEAPVATTEAPLPEGVASAPPPLLYWSMWVGVFTVVIWGFQVLMGSRRSTPPS